MPAGRSSGRHIDGHWGVRGPTQYSSAPSPDLARNTGRYATRARRARSLECITVGFGSTKALSGEVDPGSPKKTRQLNNLEHDPIQTDRIMLEEMIASAPDAAAVLR